MFAVVTGPNVPTIGKAACTTASNLVLVVTDNGVGLKGAVSLREINQNNILLKILANFHDYYSSEHQPTYNHVHHYQPDCSNQKYEKKFALNN